MAESKKFKPEDLLELKVSRAELIQLVTDDLSSELEAEAKKNEKEIKGLEEKTFKASQFGLDPVVDVDLREDSKTKKQYVNVYVGGEHEHVPLNKVPKEILEHLQKVKALENKNEDIYLQIRKMNSPAGRLEATRSLLEQTEEGKALLDLIGNVQQGFRHRLDSKSKKLLKQ